MKWKFEHVGWPYWKRPFFVFFPHTNIVFSLRIGRWYIRLSRLYMAARDGAF
jgi:hypothetical protein